MASNPELEQAIDKVTSRTGDSLLLELASSGAECKKTLDDLIPKLELEYDRIISDGRKEADKIEKQLVGGADLAARNKELMALEEAVDRVFADALAKISAADHSALTESLLDEATKTLGTTEVVVSTNENSHSIVKSALSKFPGAKMSPENIKCLGGIVAKSKDGSMTFDNTIDARIGRMKPLIRKEIASKFGVGI
ncbi:MAG: V-type ATP synthase subunit E [Nitrosopumilus sp. B06]|nr:MAG: V-type ATP synthase subunit E [Nitrosopumilus sp. D6]RNJ80436.1 MAG: V-type ATP synthase subunit E [Nitrosopumilus sp. B06]